MLLRSIVALAIATFGLSACKTASNGGSETLDIAVGGQKHFTAQAAFSNDKLTFFAMNPATNEVIQPLQQTATYKITSSGGGMQIAGFSTPLATNPDVNYGYFSKQLWPCDDAYKLVSEPAGARNSDKCMIHLYTEDNYWFTVAVQNMGPNGTDQSTYTNNPVLATLPATQHPIAAGPLKVGEVNVVLDPLVKDAMIAIDRKFQKSNSARKERNSCLGNGRAQGWLDIQSHYYCMLPYSPHRQCYSTILVNAQPTIAALPPAQQVGGLLKAYNDAFDACFAPGKSAAMATDEAAAFKYIMFTKVPVMAFSIESQNDVINAFYASKDKPETRPLRATDPYPTWQPNQPRYDAIRTQQCGFAAKLAGGVPVCK